MKEDRSGGELFYSFVLPVNSALTAVHAVLDTHTQGLTDNVLSPTLAWLIKTEN